MEASEKKSIFKDDKLREQFVENGYVIIPFLNQENIDELLGLYKQLYPKGVKGFFTTTFANNVAHREQVNSAIRKVCMQHIEDVFKAYQLFFSSFIVKAPGEDSELIMHQDMTLVDESIFTGINIWCPLVDLNEKNGAIEVLPGSHKLFKTYRGSSIPDIYDDVKDEVKSLMKSCQLKAGEAIIFDQSIIHYSPPNLSDEERPVINTFIAHQDAKIKICYWDKENSPNKIEIFEQENDFLEQFENFGHNIFDRPSIGRSLGLFDYDFPKISVEMLENKYGFAEVKNVKKNRPSFLKKLFNKSHLLILITF